MSVLLRVIIAISALCIAFMFIIDNLIPASEDPILLIRNGAGIFAIVILFIMAFFLGGDNSSSK